MIRGSEDEIDPRLENRGYSPEVLAEVQAKKAKQRNSVVSMNMKFTEHLSRYQYPLMAYVLALHEQFEKGVMPYPGSLSDQPAKIIEIFNLLSSLKYESKVKNSKE